MISKEGDAALNRILTETQYDLPGLPSRLKIAHLSDLHGRDYHPVIASLKTHKPSFICITGDFIYATHPKDDTSPLVSQPNVLPFLAACSSIAPTYVSLGNHERVLDNADLHAVGSTGVTVLDNTFVRVELDGFDLVIGGLTSPYCLEYREFRDECYRGAADYATLERSQTIVSIMTSPLPRYPKRVLYDGRKEAKHDLKPRNVPATSWLADFVSIPGHHILLSHHPEYVEQIHRASHTDAGRIQLILSGHAHGGQWRVFNPWKKKWIGVFAPGQGWWPKLTEGVHAVGSHDAHTTLVISRGLTNTARIPRFFNTPEIVYISNNES